MEPAAPLIALLAITLINSHEFRRTTHEIKGSGMNNSQRLAIQFCRLLVDGFAHAACDKSIINSVIINESIHTLIKIKCIRASLKDTKIHDKNEEPPMRRCFQCNSELLNREKNILNAVGALLNGFFRVSSSFLAFLKGPNKKRFIVGTFSPKSDQKATF